MQKLKSLLASTDVVLIVFILLGLRGVVAGANIGDALLMLSVAGLYGYNAFLADRKKPDITADLQKEISDIRTYVSAMSIRHGVKETVARTEPSKEFKRMF